MSGHTTNKHPDTGRTKPCDRESQLKQTQEYKTYSMLEGHYCEFQKKRPKYIKYGILSIFLLPLVFLVLMFSLESKLIFLVLWIISIIACASFLIVVEYKDYWYKRLLGLDQDDSCDEEELTDFPAAQPDAPSAAAVKKSSAPVSKTPKVKQPCAPASLTETAAPRHKAPAVPDKKTGESAQITQRKSGQNPVGTEEEKKA